MKIFEFKPKLVVEAVRFEHPDDGSRLAEWCGGTNEQCPDAVDFQASDGTTQRAEVGDWVIKGVAGFFVRKPEQFEAQYEAVTPVVVSLRSPVTEDEANRIVDVIKKATMNPGRTIYLGGEVGQ